LDSANRSIGHQVALPASKLGDASQLVWLGLRDPYDSLAERKEKFREAIEL